ncbi:MAG: GrpB family protein [Chloroflexi bacterium]|nr:GrpB family protein [Chloroflexota bacterium]MDA1145590.1 GrpB family protein [Chloroflexota bacterium]
MILAPHDPAWRELAASWSARILEACGDAVVVVEHVGSTAVPGLLAKPIIDLMPGLRSFEAGYAIVEAMSGLGFEARGEFGIPRRQYFNREDVHVHAYVPGEGQWQDHLDFRDELRRSAEARAGYAALKRALQQRFRFDREEYSNQKAAFVAATLRTARAR